MAVRLWLSTVKLGERISPDEAPAVYYHEMGNLVTRACAACEKHCITLIHAEKGDTRGIDFTKQHASCIPPWQDNDEYRLPAV